MNAEEPLLTGSLDHEQYDAITSNPSRELKRYVVNFYSESVFISKSVVPLAVTFFLQSLLSITSIFVLGRLGAKELAASTLAVCTFNITGLAIFQGMSTCLDTFCLQAYGAGEYLKIGMYFQRCSCMVLTLTVFPILFIWFFSGSILKCLVPDEELAILAQTYLRVTIFGAPGLVLFETGKRFLQAQHLFNAGTYVLIIVAPLNLFLNWLLVLHPTYGIGFIGAPIAVAIVYWLTSLFLLGYVLLVDGRKCWNGLNIRESFSNWGPMLKLAIPGIVMVLAEYLAFEVLTVFAAYFGTTSLAAQAVASNVGSILFQLPFAASVAITTRIGHFIGMEDLNAAKLVVRIALLVAGIISIFNFSTCILFRRQLGYLFSGDEEVVNMSSKVLVMVAINQLLDTFNVLGAGVLRGQGRQRIGSILNLVSYYMVALPLGYVLGFYTSLQLFGLWVGIVSGVISLAGSELFCIYRSDWQHILEDSKLRV